VFGNRHQEAGGLYRQCSGFAMLRSAAYVALHWTGLYRGNQFGAEQFYCAVMGQTTAFRVTGACSQRHRAPRIVILGRKLQK
jgi:hypothetical protein